jgi:hypothetical protein
MIRRRAAAAAVALAGLAAIAWTAHSTPERATVHPEAALSPDPDQGNAHDAAPPAPRAVATAPAPTPITSDTAMADRVAVLGVLNKRNGQSRDVTMRPGQAIRFGDLVVRLRACETTADWEPEQLTGAFVQADLRGSDGGWRRIFSGWLYKETPSLNVVENPLYDVWPKSCTMRHPETGPDTVAAAAVAGSGAPRRSIAKKSADDPAPEAAEPSPSAASNSAT